MASLFRGAVVAVGCFDSRVRFNLAHAAWDVNGPADEPDAEPIRIVVPDGKIGLSGDSLSG